MIGTSNPQVEIGDLVLDVGCNLTQILRESGSQPDPETVRVVKVFDWGLRIEDLGSKEQWDCEHWELADA